MREKEGLMFGEGFIKGLTMPHSSVEQFLKNSKAKKKSHSPSARFIWSDKEKQEFKKRMEDQCSNSSDQQAASHTETSQKN